MDNSPTKVDTPGRMEMCALYTHCALHKQLTGPHHVHNKRFGRGVRGGEIESRAPHDSVISNNLIKHSDVHNPCVRSTRENERKLFGAKNRLESPIEEMTPYQSAQTQQPLRTLWIYAPGPREK